VEVILVSTWARTFIVWSEILDCKSSVLQPLVVSALIDEISYRERARPSACTHRSKMNDSSEPQSKSDPFTFLGNTRAVGNANFRIPCGCVAYWFLYPCRGYYDFSQKFATQWRRRFRPHKVYIFLISFTRRVDLAMSVCPSVSTQASLSVLKLSGWNFHKSIISFASSIYVGIRSDNYIL